MKNTIHIVNLFSFIFYLLFYNIVYLYAQEKTTIAILNLETREGISKSGAGTLTDRLRTELVNLKKFSVLERAQMYTILQEQGFNQSGCVSTECAVEAGRLLGVQQMVAGEIGKVGNTLTIHVRLFNVETGEIIQAHQVDYEGDADGLLLKMKDVARDISGIEEESSFPWLWVSLGVIAAGAGAIVLMQSGGDSQDTETMQEMPEPVWPPR
jgi:TolB-like protein